MPNFCSFPNTQYLACFIGIVFKYVKTKVKQKNFQYFYYSLSKSIEGARYFDQSVFSNGNGLDTPLSHPLVDNNTASDFGFKFLSAQDISETVFRINGTDNGNKDRVPHLFMTFGQFMDHDFAYVIHPSPSSIGCKSRYLITSSGNGSVIKRRFQN